MKKTTYLVEASFEVKATSKEMAEEIMVGFLDRVMRANPPFVEVHAGEISKDYNVLETTIALDHNGEEMEPEEEDD